MHIRFGLELGRDRHGRKSYYLCKNFLQHCGLRVSVLEDPETIDRTIESARLKLPSYKTNLTKTPAYLSDIIHEYHPTRTLRSADKLLLTVSRMSLTLSAKAFCVIAPRQSGTHCHTTIDLLNFSVLSSDF